VIRITLGQMRRSLARLTAAGVAIVIGTGFVAATLLASDLITRGVYDSISAQYGRADLVVTSSLPLTTADLAAIRAIPTVAAADPQVLVTTGLASDTRIVYQAIIPTTTDPALMALTLADGRWPVGDGEIALPPSVATRLGVGIGDEISIGNGLPIAPGTSEPGTSERGTSEPGTTGPGTTGPGASGDGTLRLTVVGLVNDPLRAYARYDGAAVLDQEPFIRFTGADRGPFGVEVSVLLVPRMRIEAAKAAILAALPPDVASRAIIETPDEHAQATAESFTGGADLVFLIFVLTFAAIALLVAGRVISNTFQVLVAQRTRTLALLRAIGASKGQIGGSVVIEAVLLGAIASLVGVLAGCGLGQATLLVAGGSVAGVFLPATITVTWPVVVVPMLVGVAVTVLAALVPARVATRVAPLAAMRPLDGPSVERRSAGAVRRVVSLVAAACGFALLGFGAWYGSTQANTQVGLLSGIAGGMASFVGIAVSAVFWLPRVTAAAGWLVGRTGATAKLAAANTLRNPRRTAATSTALLIGVTLVAMMSTGAASARITLAAALAGTFPVDVTVESAGTTADGTVAPIPPEVFDAVAGVPGVVASASVTRSTLTIEGLWNIPNGFARSATAPPDALDSDPSSSATIEPVTWQFVGIDPGMAEATLNDPGIVAGLAPGSLVIPQHWADEWRIADGETVTLTGPTGSVTLAARIGADSSLDAPVITPTDLARANSSAVASTLWARVSTTSAVTAIQDAVSATGAAASVQGTAVDRATYESVINTALGIVVGLLAVAVVIALIGVANTLALSVLERRQESATLRAIGATRGQVRRMLAIEGLLIAGVGAVLGIGLGLVYGWAGALAALGAMGKVHLAVSGRDIVLVLVVALVAGLVASVAPGRSAVRPSPVAALAAE
jgi:putative ABC transport system permease protein